MELTKLITHYDRYAPIWNTDKAAFIRRYANTKRPLSSFELDISRYKNNQSRHTERGRHALGRLHQGGLQPAQGTRWSQHCQQWVNKLTNLLHHNAGSELHALHHYFTDNTSQAVAAAR